MAKIVAVKINTLERIEIERARESVPYCLNWRNFSPVCTDFVVVFYCNDVLNVTSRNAQ